MWKWILGNKKQTDSCSICLCHLNTGIVTTKCDHRFHKDCLVEWIVRNRTCPLCRTTLFDFPNGWNIFRIGTDTHIITFGDTTVIVNVLTGNIMIF